MWMKIQKGGEKLNSEFEVLKKKMLDIKISVKEKTA